MSREHTSAIHGDTCGLTHLDIACTARVVNTIEWTLTPNTSSKVSYSLSSHSPLALSQRDEGSEMAPGR